MRTSMKQSENLFCIHTSKNSVIHIMKMKTLSCAYTVCNKHIYFSHHFSLKFFLRLRKHCQTFLTILVYEQV